MSKALLNQLSDALGEHNIQTNPKRTEYYRKGFRSGEGDALAVLFPQTLTQLWKSLQACVDAGVIIIMQAAKTGLTEGSAPSGSDYDRPVVVINTLAMDDIVLLNDGEQVLSFPGATLHELEKTLKTVNRAPHSVIGSSGLGASIVGGVSNNSGGALVKRGPAYTEASLFAQVTAEGKLQLVNHLGIDLGDDPDTMIARLEKGDYDKTTNPDDDRLFSSSDYVDIVKDVDAETPARFNADKHRLFEASGCAGKLAVFAVRLDTFAVPERERTYYIGTNEPLVFSRLRRELLQSEHIPDVGEYMHRDIFDIAEKYGKDSFLTIKWLGTERLPKFFALKGRMDATFDKVSFLPKHLIDRVLQKASILFRQHLPESLLNYRKAYEHHLILKVSDAAIEQTDALLEDFFADTTNNGDYFVCNAEETTAAFLHRFVAAGAAMRYETVHEKTSGELIALDIALRRNDMDWVEELPQEIADKLELRLYYGHFMCNVFHQDYIVKKGEDAKKVKHDMLAFLDTRGAKYPAEHNVGHLYEAEPDLKNFYLSLDPTNTFNPGIGKTDKYRRNCNCC